MKKIVMCKMSIFAEEKHAENSFCAMNFDVNCEGLYEDRMNCPYWKGSQ